MRGLKFDVLEAELSLDGRTPQGVRGLKSAMLSAAVCGLHGRTPQGVRRLKYVAGHDDARAARSHPAKRGPVTRAPVGSRMTGPASVRQARVIF